MCWGGFIQSVVETGHIGVGLEGSDWSAQLGRAAWGKTKTLFTCDIGKPFQILEKGQPAKFDVITSWVVFEHIKEKDIPTLIANMQKHLAENGILIFSIGNGPDWVNGVNLHQTIKPREWWIKRLPFKNDESLLAYFGKHLIRYGHPEGDFRLAMLNGLVPILPKSSLKDRIKDCLRETSFAKKLNL